MIATPKDELVLTVPNKHAEGCGQPPGITAGEAYTGYFENDGEQLTVQIDRAAKTGILRMGDVGWDRHIAIEGDRIVDDVNLSQSEFEWLSLCWRTATGGELARTFNLALPDMLERLQADDSP